MVSGVKTTRLLAFDKTENNWKAAVNMLIKHRMKASQRSGLPTLESG